MDDREKSVCEAHQIMAKRRSVVCAQRGGSSPNNSALVGVT